ncbi:uncharacterized protein LOC110619075 [Manihot esculenta]|uniref:uncharacterized protein LOC110619075 n=1 Tax=Manihot esculenta TaxID=3983 RepID=UPI001CC3B4A1|nr:uncharacterized protein LOC110619075 [Manihot esculenta]
MRILCWNCRGVGNPRAVTAMKDLVFYYKPSILFLMETKVHGVRMNQIKNLLHYSNCFSVDSIGIGGGLSLMWNTDVQLQVSYFSSNFIDCTIGTGSAQWCFTGFYGCPEPTRRRTSWNLLRELSSHNDLPWLCCGDYNDIAAPEEKSGGPLRASHLIFGFRGALLDSGLSDIMARFFLILIERGLHFVLKKDALSSILVAPVSDHNPLVVEITAPTCYLGSRRFHFDNSWLEDPELGEVVSKAWAEGVRLDFLARKDFTANRIVQWGRNRNKLKRAQKDMIRKRLEEDLDSELFSGAVADFGEVISLVEPKVDSHDNAMLTATFIDEEFRHALFQMNPDKALGLDGLNLAFFQRHWKILGPDIGKACREWLARGALLANISNTLLMLIPKCDNPMLLKDFRPIALCNVVYKILSKALANHFKRVLDKIISPNQSAFVPGRLITDNFIVAFETIHGLKQQTRGSDGFCALKIDIAKAYDRVDWAYLSAMLSALGFSTTWIGWMCMCFSDIIYKIALNGSEIGPVIPTRGLRQGDPISPYLFLIVAEGLSLLFQNRESLGLIQGCPAKQGCPRISHLFFADDSLLFFKGTVMEASQVKSLLAVYEKASGQSINFDKSTIMFSPCIRDDICIAVSTVLSVHQSLGTSTYLGLPSLVGRSKKQIFSFLKDRIWKRSNSWNNRFLSRAGREVLIKAVLQAIPAYCMNVFLLPLATCNQLQKGDGGMGFRDLRCFNAALLGKQGWRILSDINSLLYNVLRAKYFPSGDFMSASLGSNYSYVWKSVHSSQQLLVRGTRWRVGDGRSIFVKNNPWLPSDSNFVPNDPMFIDDAIHVSDLFVPGELRWDLEKVLNIFSMDDVRSILAIPLPLNPRPDKLIWHFEKRGFYMVKTAYYCVLSMLGRHLRVGTSDLWKKVWALDVPPKVRDFIWRLFRGVLPTRDNLARRGVDVPLGCLFCDANESIDHLFFLVPWERASRLAVHAWKVWHTRNELVWNNKVLTPPAIHNVANTFYTDYLHCGLDKQCAPGPSLLSINAGSASSALDWLAYVDCATFSTSDLFGFGAVFEDAEGVFLIAISGYTKGRGSPAIAEALALRQCLMYARDAFLQAGSIFIDSQILLFAFRSNLEDFSEFGVIVSDCKDILLLCPNISLCWIRRSANKAAHLLARQSIRFDRFKL